jgi:hypothetical protein
MNYLIKEFHEYFIPDSTLLVCQDYKHWGMYWVHMIIEILSPKLRLVDILNSNTVSFKLTAKLEASDIRQIPDFGSLTVENGLLLLDNASKRLKQKGDILGSKIVQLNAIRFLVHKGEMKKATNLLVKLENEWPLFSKDSQLLQAKKWLSEQANISIPHSFKTNLRRITKMAKRLMKRLQVN